MKRSTQRLSPKAFAKMQRELLTSELEGYGPTECAQHALLSIGLGAKWPPEPQEIVLVVDATLRGSVYPFVQEDEA